jgi:AcrR family transcriptional regulator
MSAPGERGTRNRILEVAEEFLGEHGYHGTRLHQIAERVGIQKASLFHYFPSKAQLYRAVIEEGFGEMEETIGRVLQRGGKPLDTIEAVVEEYVNLVVAHRERTKIFLRLSLGDAPGDYKPMAEAQRLVNMVVRFVSEGQQAHALRPTDPLAFVMGVVGMVAFFFTSAQELGPVWAEDPFGPATVERVKRLVVDVIRRCLTPYDQQTAQEIKVAIA